MSAPALVLLAEGSSDPRVEQTFHSLRHKLQTERPSLSVNLAFDDHRSPSGPQVIGTLANRGVSEVVLVPMDLSRVSEPPAAMSNVLHAVRQHRPQVKITLSRPIGPAIELLNVLDVRLRNALSAAHATELDGLVLSVPTWGDTRGAGLLARRARQWGAHHKLPIQVSHGDGSGPDVAGAIGDLREVGRRNIAVGSLYLAPTEDFRRQSELAMASGALAVSAPLGADQRICELAMARYAFAAMELLDEDHGEEQRTAL